MPDTEAIRTQYCEKMTEAAKNSKYSIVHPQGWVYETEQEVERALWEIREIIEQYGLAWLDQHSIEQENIPTDEMGSKLYEFHTELSENFSKRYHLDPSDHSRGNAKKGMVAMRKRMTELLSLEYAAVQDDLVEISAFLSEQLCSVLGGEWILPDRPRGVFIRKMNTTPCNHYHPLMSVVDAWKHKAIELLEEEFWIFWDSKNPVTSDEIIALVNRDTKLLQRWSQLHKEYRNQSDQD